MPDTFKNSSAFYFARHLKRSQMIWNLNFIFSAVTNYNSLRLAWNKLVHYLTRLVIKLFGAAVWFWWTTTDAKAGSQPVFSAAFFCRRICRMNRLQICIGEWPRGGMKNQCLASFEAVFFFFRAQFFPPEFQSPLRRLNKVSLAVFYPFYATVNIFIRRRYAADKLFTWTKSTRRCLEKWREAIISKKLFLICFPRLWYVHVACSHRVLN